MPNLEVHFLQMDLGIQLSDEAVNDHAAYLQSWISVLENDPNELFRQFIMLQRFLII